MTDASSSLDVNGQPVVGWAGNPADDDLAGWHRHWRFERLSKTLEQIEDVVKVSDTIGSEHKHYLKYEHTL